MKSKFLLVTFIFLLLSCYSGVRTTTPSTQVDSRLNGIYKHQSRKLNKFVNDIKPVEQNDYIKQNKITGIVAVNTLINQKGNVESIFIKESISRKVDSLVIMAINDSKFKSLNNNSGEKIKYYIDMTYIFYKGDILKPLINGKAYFTEPAPSKKAPPKLDDNSGAFDSDSPKKFAISEKPILIHKEWPKYSPKARQARAQGRVTVMLTIKENGEVEKMDILTTDHDLLIISSLDAASKCKFKPAKQRGKLVKVKMSVPFDYRLGP